MRTRSIAGIGALALGSTSILTGYSRTLHADPSDMLIASISQTGPVGDGRIHFDLSGSFPGAVDVAGALQLRSEVICNGKPTPSSIDLSPPPSDTAIRVSLAEQPGRTRCAFALHRFDDGRASVPSASAEILLATPPNEITGSQDLGVNGAQHQVALYGSFSDFATLDATYGVTCNGATAGGASIVDRSPSRITVAFGNPVPDARCTFVLGGPGYGQRTNLWGPLNLTPNAVLPGSFGAYHWSTESPADADGDDTLVSGQRPLTHAGFDVVRVGMSPEMRIGGGFFNRYKHNLELFSTECPVGAPFLPCAARSRSYQKLFSAPSARVVMLTTADSSSWGDFGTSTSTGVLDPAFWDIDANRNRVVQEYRELALAIYETQQNTGKTFIIANWETDNVLTCVNGIAEFAGNVGTKRSSCESSPNPPWKRAQGMIRWFNARKEGIRQATAIAASRGIQNIVVADAIEVASIRWLHNVTPENPWGIPPCKSAGGTPLAHCLNTLDDIIPFVNPAYVSYSAWESIRDDMPVNGISSYPPNLSAPTPTSAVGRTPRLDVDLADLKTRFPGGPGQPQLIVGEFGVESNPNLQSVDDAWAFAEVARAVQRAGLPVNVAWAAYDSVQDGVMYPFGFFNSSGTERYGMTLMRSALFAGAAELAQPHPATTTNVVVTTTAVGGIWYDLFEIYGSFPTPPTSLSQVSLNCSPAAYLPQFVAANTTQVNIRMRHQSLPKQYCTVKVAGSLTHGPKRIWAGSCPSGTTACR